MVSITLLYHCKHVQLSPANCFRSKMPFLTFRGPMTPKHVNLDRLCLDGSE